MYTRPSLSVTLLYTRRYVGEQLLSVNEDDLMFDPKAFTKTAVRPKAPARPYLDPHILTDPLDKFLLDWHGAKYVPSSSTSLISIICRSSM